MAWTVGMAHNTQPLGARKLALRPLQALLAAVPLLTTIPATADDGSNPRGNIERAIRQIEAVTGKTVANAFKADPGDDPKVHCIENRFCETRIGDLRVEAIGRQIEITPTPKTLADLLVGSCIGLLRAFAGNTSAKNAANTVHHVLEKVWDGSVATLETETFQFEMTLTSEDLPSCKLVRFVQR